VTEGALLAKTSLNAENFVDGAPCHTSFADIFHFHMILLLCLANCMLLSLTFCRSLMVGWSQGRLQFKKGRMMRTLPCWIHPRFGLLRITSCHQIGLHVQDLVLFIISPCAPTPYVDIVARTSSSPISDYFNNSYDYFLLLQQLVRLLPTIWRTHTITSRVTTIRCCVTYFEPSRSCIVLGLKPRFEDAPTWLPSTLGCPSFSINSVATATLGFGFYLV
jgi:hypothetical protein